MLGPHSAFLFYPVHECGSSCGAFGKVNRRALALYQVDCVLVQLLEFLSDNDEGTSGDVLMFVREAVQRYPQLKPNVVGKLLEVFCYIKSVR